MTYAMLWKLALRTGMLAVGLNWGVSSVVSAAPPPPGQGSQDGAPPPPHGPPPEAFEACATLDVEEACSVEMPDRVVEGHCVADREQEQLFCLPDDMPPRPEGGPPEPVEAP